MEILVVAWIIGAIFVGVVASAANLGMGRWTITALVVSPLLALLGLVAVVMAKNAQAKTGGQ